MPIEYWIDQADAAGLMLSESDFVDLGSGPTLDGMDPGEWLSAMMLP